ncbi:MAG: motility associated factor glycosyltransferase family protein [Leptospiraceae bacterium]|nr:motility associated factor glycosyltransferase family protein [Leptospiraceae bacterium]
MYLKENLSALSGTIREKIANSKTIFSFEVFETKVKAFTIKVEDTFLHSRHDPIKESSRYIDSLQEDDSERLYIFLGAGLGYAVQEVLQRKKGKLVWIEPFPFILKEALSIYDYSKYLTDKKLYILTSPFSEEEFFDTFRGTANFSTSFIPHRQSFQWKQEEYMDIKLRCERFFHKKDVNIATLSRFEKSWTRNMLQNVERLRNFVPISRLFDSANDLPVLVCGAGPGLFDSLEEIREFREEFILICVDTAFHVLQQKGIEPDLIYTVDPQAINSAYLQSYKNEGRIIFDPTSSYHSLQLPALNRGYITSSPFPLLQFFTSCFKIDVGDVPFGGSVSTNSISLASMISSGPVFLAGQDLAFTEGLAHCKGAVLEERLNYKESRYFRRELHNYRQLTALPSKEVKSYTGKILKTNEKLLIFKKWFEDNRRDKIWLNISNKGANLEGIPYCSLKDFIKQSRKEEVRKVRELIANLPLKEEGFFLDLEALQVSTRNLIQKLKSFEGLLEKGLQLSHEIYKLVEKKNLQSPEFKNKLSQISKIDEEVASKKGLNEVLASGMQRVILTITEGYEEQLDLKERLDEKLSIAKKSILLYKGLLEASQIMIKLLIKTTYRF